MEAISCERDDLFLIGSGHRVCDDYALSGAGALGDYLIVADGCSGAHHSDTGARLLAHAALRQLLCQASPLLPPGGEAAAYQDFAHNIYAHSLTAAQSLSLPATALAATLLVARRNGDQLEVMIYGDGAVAIAYRDGRRVFWNYEALQTRDDRVYSAPRYLGHWAGSARINEFYPGATLTRHLYSWQEGEVPQRTIEALPFAAPLYATFPIAELETLLLFSDGVVSFSNSDKTLLPIEQLLPQLLTFKNCRGEFLKRRFVNRLLPELAAAGYRHFDDLAVAGLHIGAAGGV